MKRTSILVLTLLLLGSLVAAQALLSSPEVKEARSMGMGGAFTALSSGYQSLYGNPAGFATGRGILTLADASAWVYLDPNKAVGETGNIQKLSDAAAVMNDTTATDADKNAAYGALAGVVNDMATKNGLGLGIAAGLGFTGGGLGLGATVVSEEVVTGKAGGSYIPTTLTGADLSNVTQINFIAGLAVTLGPKAINLKVGGDIRPFIHIEGNVGATDFLSNAIKDPDNLSAWIMKQDASYAVWLAADLGAIATLGPFSAGLVIRDISPGSFANSPATFGNALAGTVVTSANDPTVDLNPAIALGLGFSPALLPGILEPAVYVEIKDPLSVLENPDSLWTQLHAGAEVKLLSFVTLRGGLSGGWLSAGAGINLLILEADVAGFTEETGAHPGDAGRSGIALNLRIHL